MQITFVRHQGRNSFFICCAAKSGRGALSARWGLGIAYQGEGGLVVRTEVKKAERSIVSSSKLYWTLSAPCLQSLKLLWTLPLIPSQENEHPGVLSVSSQPFSFSWYFLHYSYIPNVNRSSSQLRTSLFSHLSQQTFLWERAKCESQQRATQPSCNLNEHKKYKILL